MSEGTMGQQIRKAYLVQSDAMEAGVLASYLRRSGLESLTMTSNVGVLSQLNVEGGFAILSDHLGAQIDGLELARKCAGIPCVFILLVNEPLQAMEEFEAFRLGISGIFVKPPDPRQIAEFAKRQRMIPLGGGSAGLPEDGMGGNLADRHVVDLIRFCGRHELSALVEIDQPNSFAGLLIKEGRVIDAWLRDLRGRSALNSALMLDKGPFTLYLLAADAEELDRPDMIHADPGELESLDEASQSRDEDHEHVADEPVRVKQAEERKKRGHRRRRYDRNTGEVRAVAPAQQKKSELTSTDVEDVPFIIPEHVPAPEPEVAPMIIVEEPPPVPLLPREAPPLPMAALASEMGSEPPRERSSTLELEGRADLGVETFFSDDLAPTGQTLGQRLNALWQTPVTTAVLGLTWIGLLLWFFTDVMGSGS
jgi:hypothetical protein